LDETDVVALICIFTFWGIGSYIVGTFNEYLCELVACIGIILSLVTSLNKPELFFIWLGIGAFAIYSYNLYGESLFFYFGVGLGLGLLLRIIAFVMEIIA
jgi:hypothetical protein